MQKKIASFIMSKKFIPVMLVLTCASLFIAFKTQGKIENNDNPKSKYAKVIRNVGMLLEEGHYSPKKIDDSFSHIVFNKFLGEIDNEKSIFLQSDINNLKKYYNKIDDEIHGSELNSFFEINDLYSKRRDESFIMIKDILAKPFDFSKDETIQLDRDKLEYPKTETERKDIWRKSLKYNVLAKFVDLQEEREKNKGKKDFVIKADSTLEREARMQILKRMERSIATKKTHETVDENFDTFINAITQSMDPHTDYFPPIEKRSFDEEISGTFYGIGAQLKEEDGKIKIASIIPGTPSERSELKINDEIIKIAQGKEEAVDVTGYGVTDAVKLIRGAEKGSEVRLTIKRIDGSIKVIILLRDAIKLEDTFAKSAVINGDHKIGYIYLPEFYQDFQHPNGAKCSDDVAKEVQKLKAENVEGIIIDLRNNGGGSLTEVVKMAGLFIEDGPICQVKSRDEKEPYVLRDKDKNIIYSGPLTVMVNEMSASASEIFAAAIQDYKRGLIIGSTSTYGKGTVQRNIPLNPESENTLFPNKKTDDLGFVKLTLQKFYRINGGATQLRGVVPDIVLPDAFEHIKFREKDNASALPWDEIPKADYKIWTISNTNNDSVINMIRNQVSTASTFNKIKSDLDFMDINSQKEVSLNIQKYKDEQKKLKATNKELEDLFKLNAPLNFKNNAADAIAINASKDKVEKNAAWLKRISGDIYIDETVKAIGDMIVTKATVKH